MADPRRTGIIDDFDRADEYPLDGGGIWGEAFTNWDQMGVVDNRATRLIPKTSDRAFSYWTPQGFDGDCEIWGERQEQAPLLGHNDRLAMIVGADGGLSSGQFDGYQVLFHRQTSGPSVYLYRMDNGSATELDSIVTSEANSNWAYFGRVGDDLEVWMTNDLSTWTLMLGVTDTNYMTDVWMAIGEGANFGSDASRDGWDQVGAGQPTARRTQFIRRPLG